MVPGQRAQAHAPLPEFPQLFKGTAEYLRPLDGEHETVFALFRLERTVHLPDPGLRQLGKRSQLGGRHVLRRAFARPPRTRIPRIQRAHLQRYAALCERLGRDANAIILTAAQTGKPPQRVAMRIGDEHGGTSR